MPHHIDIDALELLKGAHGSREQGVCFLEAVAGAAAGAAAGDAAGDAAGAAAGAAAGDAAGAAARAAARDALKPVRDELITSAHDLYSRMIDAAELANA